MFKSRSMYYEKPVGANYVDIVKLVTFQNQVMESLVDLST